MFVKLNWSAAKDATWVSPTLQCVTPDEVFTQLKSSTFIAHDIECPFNEVIPGFTLTKGSRELDEGHYIVLKRWHNLNKGMEFRCFIRDRKFIAISQRDITAYYEFLPLMRNDLLNELIQFFLHKIKPAVETHKLQEARSYIIDVYMEHKTRESKYLKTWLLDMNPWLPVCVDSLLYSWEELENSDLFNETTSFRIIENSNLI
jgi:hypothetical protein